MPQLDESVHLSPPSHDWAARFESERARLTAALKLSPELIVHIGSTAVPDLVAKPIIDIMIGSPSYPVSDDVLGALGTLGYEDLGEAGVKGRHYFRLRAAAACNVHVVAFGSRHWHENLALRELLRSSKQARERYAAAKIRAVESGAVRLLAYSQAKSAVVQALIQEATGAKRDA